MEDKIAAIARSMIETERDGRIAPTAIAFRDIKADFTARGALGHGRLPVTLDQSAAAEFERRAKSYLDIVKRVITETDSAWTEETAHSAVRLLSDELAKDREELIASLARALGPRIQVRIDALESTKKRLDRFVEDETALFVIKQDRARVPVKDLLSAPRYAAVLTPWRKSNGFLAMQPPDFASAAKEAVGAVEALARIVVGEPKLTLGECIKRLRSSGRFAGATLKGLEEIWGVTSDTPGVRHGGAAFDLDSASSRYVYDLAQAALRLLLATDTV